MTARLPLHYKTLFHIARQCGTSAKRQAFLRREIAIIRQNVAERRINKWTAVSYLDAINNALRWYP